MTICRTANCERPGYHSPGCGNCKITNNCDPAASLPDGRVLKEVVELADAGIKHFLKF
jgi:hypothetical protein